MTNFVKIHPVGTEELRADGSQTDMTQLIVAFRNFANAPKSTTEVIWGQDCYIR